MNNASYSKRLSQLQQLSLIHSYKSLDNSGYNKVIDLCNETEEEIDKFFKAVKAENIELVKQMVLQNPMILYEFNDRMENVLHIAVN